MVNAAIADIKLYRAAIIMNGYNKDLDLTVRTLVCFEHALNTRYPHVSNACPDINRGESLDPTSTPHAWLKEKISKNQK